MWTEEYFSKFEFRINVARQGNATLLCDVQNAELSYQEFSSDGELRFNVAVNLSEENLSELLPYIRVKDYEKCRHARFDFETKGVVAYRDTEEIIFRGISQDGKPLLKYNMVYIFKNNDQNPTENLYSYLANKYFAKKKYRRSLVNPNY